MRSLQYASLDTAWENSLSHRDACRRNNKPLFTDNPDSQQQQDHPQRIIVGDLNPIVGEEIKQESSSSAPSLKYNEVEIKQPTVVDTPGLVDSEQSATVMQEYLVAGTKPADDNNNKQFKDVYNIYKPNHIKNLFSLFQRENNESSPFPIRIEGETKLKQGVKLVREKFEQQQQRQWLLDQTDWYNLFLFTIAGILLLLILKQVLHFGIWIGECRMRLK